MTGLHSVANATYIVVRPTFEIGDHTCTAPFAGYQEVQLRLGFTGEPDRVHEFYETLDEALATAGDISKSRGSLPIWYDGHELLVEIAEVDDLMRKLRAEGWSFDEDYGWGFHDEDEDEDEDVSEEV